MPEVCIVVPCFNEAHRLRSADLVAFADAHPDAALCLVDDGSADGTFGVLERMRASRPGRIFVERLPSNRGKAEAVRAGVQFAARLPSAFIGYWDADLSTPLEEVDGMLRVLTETPGCVLAMGSRVKRLGARIERKTSRHVLGRVFSTCAVQILGVSVYDSQCGAKLFRADHADIFFGEPFLTRWLFDLEMLVRLRNARGDAFERSVCEVPISRWSEVGGSKLSPAAMLSVPFELLRVRAHYNRRA